MPKLKTHSGASKRFTKTGTGKFKRGHSKMRHILTSKETKTKRKLAHSTLVSDADYKKVARMIPYARSARECKGRKAPGFKAERSGSKRVKRSARERILPPAA